tara:strand:+ start:170 stop:418 length:249 start_codon:yes stop_codon:yes gene_type:complete
VKQKEEGRPSEQSADGTSPGWTFYAVFHDVLVVCVIFIIGVYARGVNPVSDDVEKRAGKQRDEVSERLTWERLDDRGAKEGA